MDQVTDILNIFHLIIIHIAEYKASFHCCGWWKCICFNFFIAYKKTLVRSEQDRDVYILRWLTT